MITSADPSVYPTLYHSRNAASHRSTSKQSLRLLYNALIEMGNSYSTQEDEEEPLELVNSCPTPSEQPQRKSTRNMRVATPAIEMPCVAAKTGKTPGKGQSITNTSAEHVSRCSDCDGTYPMRRIIKATAKYKKRATTAKPDQRRPCHFCTRKTMDRCSGCKRYLCLDAPNNGKDRGGKRYPSEFCINVPVLDEFGSIQREKGKPVFEKEYGVLSCWHITHMEKWKNTYRNGIRITPVTEETVENDSSKKKRKKRKSTDQEQSTRVSKRSNKVSSRRSRVRRECGTNHWYYTGGRDHKYIF